jgi:hypothetical protein
MTPGQERSVRKVLVGLSPALGFPSLRTDATLAIMGTLVCEERQATEILDQMKQNDIIKEGLTTARATGSEPRCIYIESLEKST